MDRERRRSEKGSQGLSVGLKLSFVLWMEYLVLDVVNTPQTVSAPELESFQVWILTIEE